MQLHHTVSNALTDASSSINKQTISIGRRRIALIRQRRSSAFPEIRTEYVGNHESAIRSHTVNLSRSISYKSLERRINRDACVVLVGDSGDFAPMAVPNDPLYSKQVYLPLYNWADAMNIFLPVIRQETVIAIIDTGIDINHEDLRANIWKNPREIAGNGVDDDGNGYRDDVSGYN